MKKLILSLCIAGVVAAQSFSTATAQGSAQVLAERTTTVAHVVGSCRFSITNMFDGHFEAFDESSPEQGGYLLPITGPKAFLTDGFSVFCVDGNEERITSAMNAKYVDGHWLRYGAVNTAPEFVPFEKQANARTVQLKGKNWTGVAYTEDDTAGDERRRARVLHFCLIHNAHALCGNTPVKWLADRKVRSDLDRIKAILESIEFVDTPTPAGASSTSGAAALDR
ncbi:hypothetical protein [Cupriavidus basilensis]|uniref:hypothetical protein n=1 Tax=Cupriavidus basilensis TaxID=68895 RepID=UPI0039F7099D